MKKPARAGLLVYCVMVALLAWWPWNVWLIFGAAYASGLKGRRNRSFSTANLGKPTISRAQRIEQGLIASDRSNPPQENLRIIGNEHFSNPSAKSLINYVAAASGAIDQCSVDDGAGVGKRINPTA